MSVRSLVKLGGLEISQTAFLICDVQEIFRKTIKQFPEVVKVANKMMAAAQNLCIPVYVSEQYPKGLGHITKEIDTSGACMVYEKTQFSMCTPELMAKMQKDVCFLNAVVICGIESHLCVEQTAIDMMRMDIAVHLLADGVFSRSEMDRRLTFQRLQALGCFVTTSENVLFKLLKDKNHPKFKEISKLIKEPTVDTLP